METLTPSSCDRSIVLSRVLDLVGLSESVISSRREASLTYEKMSNLLGDRRDMQFFGFGSQTEGSTIPGLKSDTDHFEYFKQYVVIQDRLALEPEKINLLMLQEKTAPGYCRLQLLRSDLPIRFKFVLDEQRRYIMKSFPIYLPSNFYTTKTGPALSTPDRENSIKKIDYVLAFKCNIWPKEANEWINRERRYGWPPVKLIDEAVKDGCFVVPIGNKLSETKDLEWRISFSLTERELMFSLTTVQIKTYVVLKMLNKTFITPFEPDSISSYHCKTALFYCVEQTDPKFWRDDNILNCITKCLDYVKRWVRDEDCPHYILPNYNLFAGKVTPANKDRLISIIQLMSKYVWKNLLDIEIDHFGMLVRTLYDLIREDNFLCQKLNDIPVNTLSTLLHRLALSGKRFKMRTQESLIGQCFMELQITIHDIIQKNKTVFTHDLIEDTKQVIKHSKMIIGNSDSHTRQAIKLLIPHLSTLLASLISSSSLAQNKGIPREALELFDKRNNITLSLTYASALYCAGDNIKCDHILSSIKCFLQQKNLYSFCSCRYIIYKKISHEYCKAFLTQRKNAFHSIFTFCVTFSLHERYCAPQGMQYELSKTFTDDEKQQRDAHTDQNLDFAKSDCIPYFYYLQYLNFGKLGQRDLQKKAFNKFKRDMKKKNRYHLETSYNLLGQCYEQELMPEAALRCFIKSLRIRRNNNSANWLMSILVYKIISMKTQIPDKVGRQRQHMDNIVRKGTFSTFPKV